MLNKIYHQYKFDKNSQELLKKSTQEISTLKSQNDILAISPNNTDLSYLGIKQGTIALFPNQYFALPHYYSNPLLTQNHLSKLGEYLGELKFNQIIFRGITQKHQSLLEGIKKCNPKAQIIYLHAGPASEFLSKEKQEQLLFIQKACANKLIDKVGTNKKGLSNTLSTLLNAPCFHYIMKSTNISLKTNTLTKNFNSPKIGVFGNNGFNKNTATQITAALGIPNSELHTLKKEHFDFFSQFNVIQHATPIPHQEFIELISQMTLNYYLSYSETWGHVILESLSCGVPCLATNTSGIFDYDEKLKSYLEVIDYDNIEAIQKQTYKVLENYAEIKDLGLIYINKINEISDKILNEILYS